MERTRGRDSEFPKRVSLYENEEGLALLKELARRQGVSDSALLRTLIREEARRQGVRIKQERAE